MLSGVFLLWTLQLDCSYGCCARRNFTVNEIHWFAVLDGPTCPLVVLGHLSRCIITELAVCGLTSKKLGIWIKIWVCVHEGCVCVCMLMVLLENSPAGLSVGEKCVRQQNVLILKTYTTWEIVEFCARALLLVHFKECLVVLWKWRRELLSRMTLQDFTWKEAFYAVLSQCKQFPRRLRLYSHCRAPCPIQIFCLIQPFYVLFHAAKTNATSNVNGTPPT